MMRNSVMNQGEAPKNGLPGSAPTPLDYVPRQRRVGWFSRLLGSMSRPMPAAAYFLVMMGISVGTLIVAIAIRLIVVALK